MVEPEPRRLLLAAHPPFETVTILRAALNQPFRPRKTDGIAPGRVLAPIGLGDEVLEIALPTAVVIGKKHQALDPGGRNQRAK